MIKVRILVRFLIFSFKGWCISLGGWWFGLHWRVRQDERRRQSGHSWGHGTANNLYRQGQQISSNWVWFSPAVVKNKHVNRILESEPVSASIVELAVHFSRLLQAGITTTLNSRCSVFAAANSIYGRWDETKGEENIDFMPTILSRFDMIFVVKVCFNECTVLHR